ncbi:MAG: hypothetical protein K8T91_18605 [Planctomycetes bacterium]|nr:hypothetical protein [Planctomycetota bacterium]
MLRPALLLFCAFCLLGFASARPALAALPASYSWRHVSGDGQHVLVMVAPVSLQEDLDHFAGWPGHANEVEEVRAIRAKYTQSGLYLNNGSTVPLWTIGYFVRPNEVYLAAHGRFLVAANDWSAHSGFLGASLVVAFFDKGQLVAGYDDHDLIQYLKAKAFICGSWTVGRADSRFDEQTLTYYVRTSQGESFTFNIQNGKLIRHGSPWPYYLGTIFATLVGVPCLILLRKRSRRSLGAMIVILICLSLLADVLMIVLIDVTLHISAFVLISLIVSQMGLVAIWAGLGCSHAGKRLGVAGAMFLVWFIVGGLPHDATFPGVLSRMMAMQIAAVFLVLQVFRQRGYRWGFVDVLPPDIQSEPCRWQFTLKELLGWSVVFAVCLGINSLVPYRSAIRLDEMFLALPAMVIVVLAAWVVLGKKHVGRRSAALVLIAPVIFAAQLWIGVRWFQAVFGRSADWGEILVWGLVGLFQALLIVAVLAAFRVRSYRLLQLKTQSVSEGRNHTAT